MAKVKDQDLLKFTDMMVKDMAERDQNEFCFALARKVGVSEVNPRDVYSQLRKLDKDDFIPFVKMLMDSKYTRDVTEIFKRLTELFKKEYSAQ